MSMHGLKLVVAGIITSKWAGRIIQLISGGRIGFRGIAVNTNYPEINAHIKACLFWGLYEKQEAIYIEKFLPANLSVIELGASIGVISSIVAKKVYPNPVYCVEANPALIPIIKSNLNVNGIENAEVLNRAIGSGDLFFSASDDNTVGVVSKENRPGSARVQGILLSDIVREKQLERFCLVCDIEGSEYEFIFRDPAALEKCQFMIIELHDNENGNGRLPVSQLRDKIIEKGFEIVEEYGNVLVMHQRDEKIALDQLASDSL